MSGIKAKISATIDKIKGHKDDETNTGTGVGANDTYGAGAGTGVGTGTGVSSERTTYGSTGTNATGVDGYNNTTPTGLDSAGYNQAEYGTTGTTTAATTGTTTAATTGGVISEADIIDSKTFTKTIDHEVLIEKKTYELEHRPVQEQYVVETRKVGEARVAGKATELVGNEVNEVDHRIKEAPRGDRTVVVQDVDIPASEVRELGREI